MEPAMSIFKRKRNLESLGFAWWLMAGWTVLVAASLLWNIYEARRNAMELAYTEAQLSYNKDLVYRLWAAGHGGVYVPVASRTPPNPYLSHLKERDIKTPSGQHLTLVNPAYMTRQVHELAARLYGARAHLTSLKPLRPENAPDPWEKKALEAFHTGVKERREVVSVVGKPHLRFMRPFYTEKSCLKCHASQGYKAGDIRGGISLDIPLERFFAGVRAQTIPLAAGHFLIWVLGLAGILLRERHIRRDLNERQQAEEALRESREDLNRAQAVAHTGSWRLNLQRNELTWSEETHRIFGIPAGTSMTYEAFLDAVHPEDRQYVDQKWMAALKGEPYDIEHRIQVDGRVKWVRERAQLELDPQGQLLGGFGTTQDITDLKQAEEALRESEARFKSLFENMAEGVVLHEIIYNDHGEPVDYRILATNPAFERHTGLKPEQVNGRLASQAFGAEDAPYLEIFAQVVQTGQSAFFETFFPPLQRYFSISATSPKTGHFVTVFEDITERKQAEEALRRAHDELEERVRERTADLHRMVEQLEREIAERQRVEETLRESEDRLRQLATQLLTAQEAERKRLALELHDGLGQSLMALRFQMNAVGKAVPAKQSKAKSELAYCLDQLNEVVENVRSMSHNLVPPVLQDLGLKVALEQLLAKFGQQAQINLSWDVDELRGMFSPEAEVTIYRIIQESLNNIAKHAQATQIKVSVKRRNGEAAFLVEDNGQGFNVREIRARRGLGLAAMDERVRLLGGEFQLSSKPGKGTKLTFTVPKKS
jgi:PAS domain S-box-containing protein